MSGAAAVKAEERTATEDAGAATWTPVVVVTGAPPRLEHDDATHQTEARYIHGVERIAAAFGAEDPVVWRGGRAWLSFGNGPPERRLRRAWRAAKELWERACLGLGLPARVGVLCGVPTTGGATVADRLGERADALFSVAPERTLAADEEVALSLRAADRDDLGILPAEPDGEPLYVYPRDAAPAPREDEWQDLQTWAALQEYAQSPDVREVHYVGFRLPRRVPPVLDILDIFVEPTALVRQPESPTPGDDVRPVAHHGSAEVSSWAPPVRQALARHRHIVFLGEPGAGKTTLLRWLAVVAAQGHWPFVPGEAGPRLPLLLSMGRLAESLATSGATGVEVIPLYFEIQDPRQAAAMARFLERQFLRGRCVMLLDGLDEVRAQDRSKTEAWLTDFGARFPRNVFVATSRFVGYSGLRVPADAAVAKLGSFGSRARERFVNAFCRAYLRWETGEDRPAEAEAQATALLEAIESNERLASLARNPFMLSALALIHRAEGRLPRHRVQAYEMFLRALCETWAETRKLHPHGDGTDGTPLLAYEEQAIPVLGSLALAMHERFPQGVAPVDFVRDNIAVALRSREDIDEPGALAAAETFLVRAAQDVQLLLERGPGQWGFLHLTFQEFFVAAGLHAGERFEDLAMAHLLEPRWEEIVRLGVGYLALVQKRPVAAQRFIERVLAYEAPEPWSLAVKILGRHIGLAALLAVEAGEALPPRAQRNIADRFAAWFCEGSLQDLVDTSSLARQDRGETWLRQMALSDFGLPVTEAFVRRLQTSTPRGKYAAAFALRVLGAKLPSEVIIGALENDPEAWPWAFSALLASNATDEELTALIKHSDERVRTAVVQALDGARRPARATLLGTAASDPSEGVRRAAVSAKEGTAQIGEGWSGPETPSSEEETRLLSFLRDPSAQLRSIALERLGESLRPDVRAEIERLAREDPDDEVKRSALARWARWGGPAALGEALTAFSAHADDLTWDFERGLLAAWIDPSASIAPLLAASLSPEAGQRATAGNLLGRIRARLQIDDVTSRALIDAALTRLAGDTETVVRRETLRGVDASMDSAFNLACSATHDTDPSVRLAAFEALGRRQAHAALAAGLDDTSPNVRAFCLSARPVLASDERERRLEIAAIDPSPLVRQTAARWLNLAGQQTERMVGRFLTDVSIDVRRATAESVANHHLPFPVELMTPLLDDPYTGVRWAAARALRFAGDPGMLALVSHPTSSEARAALWVWADQRQWSFPPSTAQDD